MDENINPIPSDGGEQLQDTPMVDGEAKESDAGTVEGKESAKPTESSEGILEKTRREWQSQKDGELAGLHRDYKGQLKTLKDQLGELQRQAQETQYTKLLGQIEEAGGGADLTTLTKNIIEQAKVLAGKDSEFSEREARLADGETQYQAAMKLLAADELVKTHKLPADARAKLLEAENPDRMEVLALQMKLEKAEQESKPPTQVDGGTGTGPVQDINKLPPMELFKQAFKEKK